MRNSLVLLIFGLSCIYIGAYFSNNIIGERDVRQHISKIENEMSDKVEILGEITLDFHNKLKICLDEKYKCDCRGLY